MTADDMSTRALQLLGVYSAEETPPNADLAAGFIAVNDWLSDLGTLKPTMYYLLRTTHVLASGTASYTIGVGGTINIQRPTYIAGAKLIIDNGAAAANITEIPIGIFGDQEWMDIPQKGFSSSLSQGIYYDHGYAAATGLGLIYPWPIPNVATTTLVLYTPQALNAFANRNTTDYTFPPGYARAIRYNLACELAPLFEKDVPPRVERIAISSMADIQRANFRQTTAGMDPALSRNWRGSGYSIFSDTFR